MYDLPGGTVVLDERIFQVRGIRLHHGSFWIEALGYGPWRAEGDMDYQLHGSDGTLIVQARSHIPMVDAYEGDSVTVTLELRVDDPDKRGRPLYARRFG